MSKRVHSLWFKHFSAILDPVLRWTGQSLNVPPYFDGNNYVFWKVRMRAFLCSIDDTVWDVIEVGWTKAKGRKIHVG